MPSALVECIPNFSDARRPEVIEKIRQSIAKVPLIKILDQHSDLDHNRTVITFIGPANAVEEAAFQAISTAASLIDLNIQTGEHPRIGATDVVPFVPIKNISMQECVELARRLAKRVGENLQIPVYLYEEAATSPERRQLDNIRQGEFEQLKKEIQTNSDRKPDFGPSKLGPAGATVIGARQPLIAYNVHLGTDDVSTAQKIAQAVRFSSGGLRYVRAMGSLTGGHAQISLNLTNFNETPVYRAVEMIRSEAARYGTIIHHCELIGLIPQDALIDSAVWYLQLDGFEPDQVLENHLILFKSQTEPEVEQRFTFLDDLAGDSITPAGGAAAAFTGSAAASLVAMVAKITVGKKAYSHIEDEMQDLIVKAEAVRSTLKKDVDSDGNSFMEYMDAMKLPGNTPEQQSIRLKTVEIALLNTARVSLETAEHTLEAMQLALTAARLGNINAIADAANAVILGRASVSCMDLNIKSNLQKLQDNNLAVPFFQKLKIIEENVEGVYREMNEILKERSKLNLPGQ